MPFDDECRSQNSRITPIGLLPHVVTQHNHGRRSRTVIVRRDHSAAECAEAKRGEVISCHIFGAQRPWRCFYFFPAHTHTVDTGLKCCYLLELRCLCFQALIERKGKHSPCVLWTALNTAIVAFTNS